MNTAGGESEREYRERLIEHILGGDKARVGIYGGKVCAACGELGTYRGLWAAVGSHRGAFVAIDHVHGLTDEDRAALARRPWSYCEVCRERIDELDGDRLVICTRCSAALRECHDPFDEEAFLRYLARRRFLDIACPTLEDLREWDIQLENFKLQLEELNAKGRERQRLEAAGPARWRAVLEELSRVHGVDYLAAER